MQLEQHKMSQNPESVWHTLKPTVQTQDNVLFLWAMKLPSVMLWNTMTIHGTYFGCWLFVCIKRHLCKHNEYSSNQNVKGFCTDQVL